MYVAPQFKKLKRRARAKPGTSYSARGIGGNENPHGKFPALVGEILGVVNSEIPPRRAGLALI